MLSFDVEVYRTRQLSQAYVRNVLHYDPITGLFTWRPRPALVFATELSWLGWTAKNAGQVAGNIDILDGYVRIGLLGRLHKGHRLAFLYMDGVLPLKVDHENGRTYDNRWLNLRAADNVQNGRNQKLHVTNTSGHAGVSKIKGYEKWAAYIGVDNRPKWLGAFSSLEEAVAARKEAEVREGYHENHGSIR